MREMSRIATVRVERIVLHRASIKNHERGEMEVGEEVGGIMVIHINIIIILTD